MVCARPLFRQEFPGGTGVSHESGGKGDCNPKLNRKPDCLDNYPAATGGLSGKGVYDLMSNEKMTQNPTAAPAPEDRPALVKKIGRTAYRVSFHFSTTSTENMSDKIKRLIKRDMGA